MSRPVRKPIEVFKKTDDNWCPNFKGNLVAVHLNNYGTKFWVVTCHGDDDLYRSSGNLSYEIAMTVFMKILEMETVSINAVERLGLTNT